MMLRKEQPNETAAIVQSPCVRNCCLNDDDICLGCFRSLNEITAWGECDNQKRMMILQNAQRRHEEYKLRWGVSH